MAEENRTPADRRSSREESPRADREDPEDTSEISNPEVRHEKRDVKVKVIVYSGIGLTVLGIFTFLLIGWVFNYFSHREAVEEGPPPVMAIPEAEREPPAPRLQLSPAQRMHPLEEMKTMRESENRALSTYGWVDQNAGIVHIPIEEAKKMLLQRGLASRPQGAGQQGFLEQIPESSSSGRTTENLVK